MWRLISHFIKWILFLLPFLIIIPLFESTFSVFFPPDSNFGESLIIFGLIIASITLIWFLLSKSTGLYLKRKKSTFVEKFPFLLNIIKNIEKIFLVLNFSKEIFEKPVIIKRENWKELKFWFVTNSNLENFWLENYSSIYLPNPFSFFWEIVVVSNNDIEKMPVKWEKVSSFILTCGIIKDPENNH